MNTVQAVALINGIGKTDRWVAGAWYSRRTAWGTSLFS